MIADHLNLCKLKKSVELTSTFDISIFYTIRVIKDRKITLFSQCKNASLKAY